MRRCAQYFEKKVYVQMLSSSSFNMAPKRFGQGLSCTWKSDKVLYKQVAHIQF